MADEQELTYSYQTVKALVQHRDEEISALTQQLADAGDALENVLEEFNQRYDGAPDSRVLWMGQHITDIERILALIQPTAGDAAKVGQS